MAARKRRFFAVQPFNFGRSRIKWLYRSETDYLSFELRMHEAIWVDPQRRVFIVISAEGSDSPLSTAQWSTFDFKLKTELSHFCFSLNF